MSDVAIKVEGLSKKYRIGVRQERHDTLRDQIVSNLKSIFGHCLASQQTRVPDSIWALKDVSFEVKQGEVLGIIGRNGAGKSTLLKILSRITEPTAGRIEISGRVASLLEVGTGFHPELTGRENVYFNGAILGMKKSEIDRKFDEIVAFAEVEKFIDTPVKRYSSGMYVRLAFAVAAHLDSEVLILDEVLAVGDMSFQRKCLGMMEQTAKGGKTVLFVSHNMLAIQSLCTRGIFLNNGSIVFSGPTSQAVNKYLESVKELQIQPIDSRQDRLGGHEFRFTGLQFLNPETMKPWNTLMSGQSVVIRIGYRNLSGKVLDDVGVGIAFYARGGSLLFSCRSRAVGVSLQGIGPGDGFTDCIMDRFPLKEGYYSINLYAEKHQIPLDDLREGYGITVEAADYYGSGCLPAPGQPAVLVDYRWAPNREASSPFSSDKMKKLLIEKRSSNDQPEVPRE
jgi:lipopolysaccharide transport system ATP-binding protein